MHILILCFYILSIFIKSRINGQQYAQEDRLSSFYQRILESDVKHCTDKTKLLPDCNDCIPGLERSNSDPFSSCNRFVSSSRIIRDEIKKLTLTRYGVHAQKPFGLYPYLEKPDFLKRQLIFGKMLSTRSIKNIIDVGAYYNPIHLFFSKDICPVSVIIIEPILEPLSIYLPCTNTTTVSHKATHVMFLPITFKFYLTIKSKLPSPEYVVCIGCDSHYGPNRNMLETSFQRPYSLFIEYPSEYIHNAPYKKMNGEGPGEEMTYINKFQPKTNETQYTKRVMKVIEYHSIS